MLNYEFDIILLLNKVSLLKRSVMLQRKRGKRKSCSTSVYNIMDQREQQKVLIYECRTKGEG